MKSISVGALRTALTYRNPTTMKKAWFEVFGEELPAEHIEIPCEKATIFVMPMTVSQRGRSKDVTEAAKALIAQFSCGQEVAPVPTPEPEKQEPNPESPAPIQIRKSGMQLFGLYLLMGSVAIASLQNVYRITFDITEEQFAAVLLTGIFSAGPFILVLSGIRTFTAKALTVALILYECFCNFTRIYGGLTGFGKAGFPTRFLGLVTDVFAFGKYQAGTHETAIVISAVSAILAAAIFYASFKELSK